MNLDPARYAAQAQEIVHAGESNPECTRIATLMQPCAVCQRVAAWGATVAAAARREERERAIKTVEALSDAWAEFPSRLGDRYRRRMRNEVIAECAAALRAREGT